MSELQQILAAIQQSESRTSQALSSIDAKVTESCAKIARLETSLVAHDARIEAIEKALRHGSAAGSDAGSAASSAGGFGSVGGRLPGGANPFPFYSAANQNPNFVPPRDRCTLYCGGFPGDAPKDIIETGLRYAFRNVLAFLRSDPRGIVVPFARCNFGYVHFVSPDAMWKFIREHKGQMLKTAEQEPCTRVWFSVDRPVEERNISKQVTQGIRELRAVLAAARGCDPSDGQLDVWVEGCYRRKIIYYTDDRAGTTQRVFELNKTTGQWTFNAGNTLNQVLGSDIQPKLREAVETINSVGKR